MSGYRDDCLLALQRSVREEQDAFGLRPAMTGAGERLVDVAEELAEAGLDEFLGSDRDDMFREDRFVAAFVCRVAGSGGLFVDGVVRRSATRSAVHLVAKHAPLRQALQDRSAGGRVDPDWLCVIWKLFFADIVETFVAAAVAEHVRLAVPARRRGHSAPGDPDEDPQP